MTAAKPSPLAVDSDLPEGWITASVMDLCSLVRGVSYKKGEETGEPKPGLVPLLRANNIDNTIRFENMRFVPRGRVSEEQELRRGDVVVAMSSGSKSVVGKAATVTAEWHGTFGAFCGVLRPNPTLDWRYFGLFFQTRDYRDRISELAAGVNINNLKREYFEGLEFPVAPLAEQKRIVEKVEQLLASVNAARERLACVPAILKRFRQAVLATACSGRLTAGWRENGCAAHTATELLKKINPMALQTRVPDENDPFDPPEIPDFWRWVPCQAICDQERPVTYGVIKLGPPVDEGVPTLRSSDVRWLWIDERRIKRISPKIAAAYSRTFLKGGELLVTVRGSLGGVAVVPARMAGFNISREVAMLPVHSDLDARFVAYAIGCAWSQAWLAQVTIGVAYTGINIRDLKRLPLPVPPIDEQREIVRRVEALFKLADSIEKRVAAATARADKLTQAILAKAFRGELVSTEAELARGEGRPYEPASALLARIRTAQEGRPASGRHAARHRSAPR